MPLTFGQIAQALNLPQLQQGVIAEYITPSEMLAVLPFKRLEAGKIQNQYNREAVLLGAKSGTIGQGYVPGKQEPNTITDNFVELVVSAEIPSAYRNNANYIAGQIAMNARSVTRTAEDLIANGNAAVPSLPNTAEVNGLASLVTGPQTIDKAAVALTLEDFDNLAALVTMNANALVLNVRAINRFRSLLRAAGGETALAIMTDGSGRQRLMWQNIFIYRNDFIKPTGAAVTTITDASILIGDLTIAVASDAGIAVGDRIRFGSTPTAIGSMATGASSVEYTVLSKATNVLTLNRALPEGSLPLNGSGVFKTNLTRIYAANIDEETGLYGWLPGEGTTDFIQEEVKPISGKTSFELNNYIRHGVSLASTQSLAALTNVPV